MYRKKPKQNFESCIYIKISIHSFSSFTDGKGNPGYYRLVKLTPIPYEIPGQTIKL